MDVEVKDLLSAIFAYIDNDTVTRHKMQHMIGNRTYAIHQHTQESGVIAVGQRCYVLPGDDEYMHRRLRMNIFEGIDAIILVDFR